MTESSFVLIQREEVRAGHLARAVMRTVRCPPAAYLRYPPAISQYVKGVASYVTVRTDGAFSYEAFLAALPRTHRPARIAGDWDTRFKWTPNLKNPLGALHILTLCATLCRGAHVLTGIFLHAIHRERRDCRVAPERLRRGRHVPHRPPGILSDVVWCVPFACAIAVCARLSLLSSLARRRLHALLQWDLVLVHREGVEQGALV